MSFYLKLCRCTYSQPAHGPYPDECQVPYLLHFMFKSKPTRQYSAPSFPGANLQVTRQLLDLYKTVQDQLMHGPHQMEKFFICDDSHAAIAWVWALCISLVVA